MPKAKPGEVHDKNGVPVYPGDLIRSFHFRGARRKVYYLYHTAIWNTKHETMEMVPTEELEPTKAGAGGRCWLAQDLMDNAEVISGCGPGDYLDHTDRKRVKIVAEVSQ